MAKKKCYKCKNQFDTSELKKANKHWLCPNCYEEYKLTEEYKREKCIDDFYQLYPEYMRKPQVFYIQLANQVDSLSKEYKMPYDAISLALEYYLMSNDWLIQYGIYQAFPKAFYIANDICKRQESLRGSMTNIKPPVVNTVKTRTKSYKPPLPL